MDVRAQSAVAIVLRKEIPLERRQIQCTLSLTVKVRLGIESWWTPSHAITSCSSIKTRIFSTAPFAGSLLLVSRTERASYWCQRSRTGTHFAHGSRPRAWTWTRHGNADN